MGGGGGSRNERGTKKEREREKRGMKKESGGSGKWVRQGDGRDVSWRPTLRGKRSGLPGVPWETDLVAESEFHLRRTKD